MRKEDVKVFFQQQAQKCLEGPTCVMSKEIMIHLDSFRIEYDFDDHHYFHCKDIKHIQQIYAEQSEANGKIFDIAQNKDREFHSMYGRLLKYLQCFSSDLIRIIVEYYFEINPLLSIEMDIETVMSEIDNLINHTKDSGWYSVYSPCKIYTLSFHIDCH
jgi:hypothetical protein